MKRFTRIFLALMLFITGYPFYPVDKVLAIGGTANPFIDGSGKYRTGSWFVEKGDEAGSWYFVTPNKKAKTGIRYRTVKFVMRLDTTCSPPASPGVALTAQCRPVDSPSDKYVIFDLNNTADVKREDVPECTYATRVGASTDGCDQANIVVSVFKSTRTQVESLLNGNPTFRDKIRQGTTVYFNSIFKTVRNGALEPGEYTTLVDIRDNTYGWSNKSYFIGYYDVPVEFHGARYKLTIRYLRESDKTPLQADEIVPPDTADPLGYLVYDSTGAVPSSGFPKSIIGSDGKVYTLKCSYTAPTRDRSTVINSVGCSSSQDPPYRVRLKDVVRRNPTMAFKGTDVVALYEEADCKCFTTATIPNKTTIEGDVPADQSVIGKQVPLQVDLEQTPDELDNWYQWVKGKSDFRIKVRLWRSDQTDVMTGLANTGDKAMWTAAPGYPTPATDSTADYVYPIDKWVLLAHLDGGNDSKAIYNDDLTNYPIPPGGKVSFRYNADVKIIARNDVTGLDETKDCSRPPKSTEMAWGRPARRRQKQLISSPSPSISPR